MTKWHIEADTIDTIAGRDVHHHAGRKEPVKPDVLLFVQAQPEGLAQIRSGEEHRRIKAALQAGTANIRMETSLATTWASLYQDLVKHQPKMIHVSAHGTREQIILVDDEGLPHAADGLDLAWLLQSSVEAPGEFAFLNSCYGREYVATFLEQFRYVIVWDDIVSDQDAIVFAEALYRGLASGLKVTLAYHAAEAYCKGINAKVPGIYW